MKILNLIAVVCALFAAPTYAQIIEMSTDIVEDNGEQMQMMSFSTSDGFDMASGPSIMLASPGLDGGFSFGTDQFSLLNNSDVQSELNLVDEQVERLNDVRKEFRDQINEVTSQLRGENGNLNLTPEMIEKLRQVTEEVREKKREEIEGLLLPEQIERLKQLALQRNMKQRGTANALGSEEVAEALGLDEKQIEALREKSKELAERVQKEIEAAKEKAREELLGELTDEQREKLSELLGEEFESSKSETRIPRLRSELNR